MYISVMNRNELEHIKRAAGAITGAKKILIFGSQSILAQFPKLTDIESNFADRNHEALFKSVELI